MAYSYGPFCMGRNGQRLLKKRPTVSTRGMSYNDANMMYADAHTAGTLSDADYVEWIVSVQAIIVWAMTL